MPRNGCSRWEKYAKYESDLAEEEPWKEYFRFYGSCPSTATTDETTEVPAGQSNGTMAVVDINPSSLASALASMEPVTARPTESRSLRVDEVALMLVPKDMPELENETLALPFPINPKQSYRVYLRVANQSTQPLKKIRGLFEGSYDSLEEPVRDMTKEPINVLGGDSRLLMPSQSVWEAGRHHSIAGGIVFDRRAPPEMRLADASVQDAIEVPSSNRFRHILRNVDPFSRWSRVVACLECDPKHEKCQLDFTKTHPITLAAGKRSILLHLFEGAFHLT